MEMLDYLFKIHTQLIESAESGPMNRGVNKSPASIPGPQQPWRTGKFSSYSLINRPYFRIASFGIESRSLATSCEPTLKEKISKSWFYQAFNTKLIDKQSKRPFKKVLYLLISVWIFICLFLCLMYDPLNHVASLWWFNAFLSILGMYIISLISYNKYTKWPLWFAVVSMAVATFGYLLLFCFAVKSFSNGEISYFYYYDNFLLKPLYSFIIPFYTDVYESVLNLFQSASCEGEEDTSIIGGIVNSTGLSLPPGNPPVTPEVVVPCDNLTLNPDFLGSDSRPPQVPFIGGGGILAGLGAIPNAGFTLPSPNSFTAEQYLAAGLGALSISSYCTTFVALSKGHKVLGLTTFAAGGLAILALEHQKNSSGPPTPPPVGDGGQLPSVLELNILSLETKYVISGLVLLCLAILYIQYIKKG